MVVLEFIANVLAAVLALLLQLLAVFDALGPILRELSIGGLTRFAGSSLARSAGDSLAGRAGTRPSTLLEKVGDCAWAFAGRSAADSWSAADAWPATGAAWRTGDVEEVAELALARARAGAWSCFRPGS